MQIERRLWLKTREKVANMDNRTRKRKLEIKESNLKNFFEIVTKAVKRYYNT